MVYWKDLILLLWTIPLYRDEMRDTCNNTANLSLNAKVCKSFARSLKKLLIVGLFCRQKNGEGNRTPEGARRLRKMVVEVFNKSEGVGD